MEEHQVAEVINSLLSLLPLTDKSSNDIMNHIKLLRNSCARGREIQNLISSNNGLIAFSRSTLFETPNAYQSQDRIQLFLWQLLANCVVNNKETQKIIWAKMGDSISLNCVQPPFSRCTDIQLMIIYNVLKGGTGVVSDLLVLRCITQLWQALIDEKCMENLEFLHFLFEHFLVDNRTTVRNYAQLESTERLAFLDYIANYLRKDSPNGNVGTFLMQYFAKEFKMKSDCIMRQSTKDVEDIKPREAYGLLRVIAAASGSASYSHVFSTDHALFLNVSSLLRCLVAAGKEPSKNIFTPLSKLEEVALSSKISYEFENEISFELKTLLVRCVANMLYENKTNKLYCLDTQLIPTLLECTNMDARNPLVKEWSILAIRNACVDCPEIQEIIANLTNQGIVKNDIVKDLNLDMGSLRIQ